MGNLKDFRLAILALALSAGATNVSAQCVVASTNFDTNSELCCPILTSDAEEEGWYNEELDWDGLCKSDMFIGPEYAKQNGIGGVFASDGSNDMTDIDEVFHLNNLQADGKPAQYGYSTVAAQPKLVHSFCKANEVPNNMYVNIGSAPLCPIVSYTVHGLAPGTTAELSFTLHNLMDPTYFDHLATNVCVGGGTAPQMRDFITKYNYSNQGVINGNKLGFGVVSSDDNVQFNTSYNNALQLTNSRNAKTVTADYGESTTVTHKATVPATGTVTFYFYRTSDCFQIPIGIDDIKVTGEVKPVISTTGNPCPEQPLRITSKQSYPDGTKFSWKESVTGQTSTDQSFNFVPDAAETDYSITLEVTLPGCEPSKSDVLKVHSGTCCTSAEGAPMAMTNLFFDDFGNFPTDDTYEWTDRFGTTHTEKIPAGQVHTSQSHGGDLKIPYVKAYNIESSGAKLAVPVAGSPGKTELYNHGVYVVSKYGGYPGGVPYDNSGTQTGGMLQFDLLDDGSQDEFFEIDVEHICTGKEITFGADFASISNHPGSIEVKLEYNGKDLVSEKQNFTGGVDGWKGINKSFTINAEDVGNASEVTITMKVKHNDVVYGETRDYAIDNIIFQVCTPPDVNVESSVSTGKDILDLCTEDVLTLTSVTSDAVKRFYLFSGNQIDPNKKVGYVYQYTFQDPSTESETNPIKWNTLHKEEVVETESFDVNVETYWDDIFSQLEDDPNHEKRIYFRVVVGEYSDLIADQSWKTNSAFSPCRKISISTIPVVAGLNCAACSKPDPLTFDAEGGIFDAKKKTVSLCPNGSTVLSAGSVHGKDKDGKDYYDYDVKWFKEVVGSAALEVKKCTSDDAVIPTVTVDYADVKAAGEAGVKYIVSLHDYFDPTLATTQCDITDTITVIALPQPEDKLTDPDEFCEGTGLKSKPILTISNKEVIWYDSETDTSEAGKSEKALTQAVIEAVEAAASPKEFYYVVQDENGCRSEVNTYTVTVNPIPDALVTSGVQYLKADLLKNLEDGEPFKSLEAQNSEVVSGSETGATVMWMGPFAGQEGVEAEQPAKGTPSSDEYVMFELADITDGSKDELYYYWVYQKSAEGCEGDTVKIQVDVLGAPAPETSDTTYCLGGTSATLEANSFVNTQVASADKYGLKWYDSKGNELEDSFLPPTDEVGETTYYVSQYDLENPDNESKKMPIVVTVVGVKEPEFKDLVTEYCSGDKAAELPQTLTFKESEYYFASEVVWYKKDEAGNLDSAATYPIDTDVTETKTYDFTAKQKYTIEESGEVCVSAAAEFSVTVNFSPAAKDTTISYLSSDATSEKDKNGDNLFESIADKGWKEEPGYTYKYVAQGTTDTTTTPPRPACDTASLDGTTKTITYEVYRINNSTSCRSEVSTIKVTISDALPPLVNDVLYCEGEDLQALTAKVQKQGSKEEDDYTILWYGTTEPASTAEAEAELEGASYPLTGKATVSDDKLTEVTYWVAQRDETTGAVSSAVPLKVIVYPNPDLTITDPAAVCEKEVDLASAVTLTNEVEGKTYAKSYFSDASGETQLKDGSKVSGSNTYYVQYAYDAKVASGKMCKSEIEPIKVQIDTLTVIAEDVSTCPKMTATFTAQAKTNVETVTYKWSGTNSDSGTGAEFTTQAFDGDYGASYDYKLVVTAGTCTEPKDLKVSLGEGPVVGTLKLADATNTSLAEKVYTNSNTSEPYYFCDAVTVTPKYDDTSDKNNVKEVSEYTLSKGDVIINAPYELNEAGKYTLSFVNGCPTKVEFELIDASVEITSLKSSKLEICEGEEFSSSITVAPQNSIGYTVTWKKDDGALNGENGEIFKIEETEPSHSGLYTVEVNRKGCVAKEEVGELKVKPYIKLIEDKNPKIIRRGESVSLSLNVKEPADVSGLNVVWNDNGSAVSEAEDKLSYTIAEVTKDYEFSIDLSGDGLCPASTEMTVWVDADLQLTTELSDTLCEDLDYTMTIDTAGTGKFRQQGVTPTLKVIREMGGATLDVSDDVKFKNGKLELTLTAEKDATYKAVFTYGDQEEESSELAIVIPSIKATSPETPTICEGEEVVLAFTNVTPEGTVIKWANDNTIMSKTEDGKSATVAPKYNKTAGAGHQSVYAYDVEAYNKTCDSYLPITVTVKVDEPLSGSIIGDSPICEGSSSLLSASSYDAETYQWTTSGTTVGTTADITVYPPVTTQYNLNMTRGRCEANDQYTVTVTSNPEIISVDSVGVRDVEIVVDPSKGTGLFSYWLDGDQETMTTNTLIKDLTFASHLITVVDANGCTSNFNFSIEPPKISIPIHFSPNGDGVNDRWVISTLSEVYPNAVVRIYDRFGKLLAEYLGADEGWDGTYNGVKMMSTDYWYVVEIEEIATKYEGHFTLIRR
jgi:gliding motility-associated-like protein